LGTWSSLLDDANGVQQEIGTYYFKLEADLSVYDSSKPTNLLYYQTVGESYYEINLLSVIVVTYLSIISIHSYPLLLK
jgi:hypothetical protein